MIKSSFIFLILLVYCSVFFVIFNLVLISDLWLLLVYSSIANTGMLIIRVYGSNYIFVVVLYLRVVFIIIYFLKSLDSYFEILLIVFMFIVVPPFVLFFIKFYVIIRVDFFIKIGFFLSVFDVLVLVYYFRLIFMKFLISSIQSAANHQICISKFYCQSMTSRESAPRRL